MPNTPLDSVPEPVLQPTPLTAETLDLTTCNNEQIHLIGEVQGHGRFLAVTLPDFSIAMVSGNFGEKAKDLIGRKLSEVLAGALTDMIRRVAKEPEFAASGHSHFEMPGDAFQDVYLFRMTDRMVGVEITDLPAERSAASTNIISEALIHPIVQQMKMLEKIEDLGSMVCRNIRHITRLDRVMLYRFSPTWHGEVIAEDRHASAHSFLHHRFPASDIPKPARDLYLRNQVRFIYDSAEESFPILPKVNPQTRSQIDLSDSRLRAVSKFHLEYLRNMGVVTSFSVAVTVNGRLWGLIAGHGTKKTYISHQTRAFCATQANLIALMAPLIENRQLQAARLEFDERLLKTFFAVQDAADPVQEVFRRFETVNDLFSATGVALITANGVEIAGVTPTSDALQVLRREVLELYVREQRPVIAIDQLTAIDPIFEALRFHASGALCAVVSGPQSAVFAVFRREQIRTVLWGGDPRKQVEQRHYQGQINPRASFESWTETVKGTSVAWRDFEIAGISHFVRLFFDGLANRAALLTEVRGQFRKS